ncbi:helix-turn-helix transcriptional regulator [Glycomyces sp. A-F 0318]|uniref:helix-turn-helix domain-containing protein n=1 Tax=Glycomyces amatae TaxID=2881355 RepID=UPI001E4186BC|nr:helix-turn-helix transcriptional regulator [Glycomyces amatae]MCD0443407.1 helix-turn-helix transcriptional regulator [Glycomyces amatae]
MGRSALRHPARATPPARPAEAPLTATLRRLDDGSTALVLTAADARRLREPDTAGTTLTVHVTAASTEDAARTALAAGLRTLASGPLGDAYASLTLAATLAAPTAPRLALTATVAAAGAAWSAGEHRACTAALDTARRALAPGSDPRADYLLGLKGLIDQAPLDALGPLRRVLARAEGDRSPETLHLAAVAALLLGDVTASCEIGMRALADARTEGRDDLVPRALEYLAYAEMRAGRHARARSRARDGLAAALRTGAANTAAHHRAVLALTASVEGDDAAAASEAAMALATARRHGLAQTAALAEWALARTDLGAGRPEAAATRLRDLVRPGGGHFAVRPLLMPCFIEAAVLAGRTEEARTVAEEFRAWAGFGIDRAAAAQLARAEALIAASDAAAPEPAGRAVAPAKSAPETADALFQQAVRLHSDEAGDFERARTLLLYGKWLRRRRRPRQARTVLRDALHGFERSGAAGWAEQAREELRATGEPGAAPRRPEAARIERAAGGEHPGSALDALTPHQLRIARKVATGATNREVAQALSLSVRTVDHHLRSIFAALGVRSRVELARMVAAAPGAQGER